MTLIIVEDELVCVSLSTQLTIVPFIISLFARLITSLDISGRLFGGEILVKINLMVALTVVVCDGSIRDTLSKTDLKRSSSSSTLISHSRTLPVICGMSIQADLHHMLMLFQMEILSPHLHACSY